MITEASVVLNTGLRGVTGGAGAHFKQVTIVIPGHWDPAHCRARVVEAVGGIAYQVCSNRITGIAPLHLGHTEPQLNGNLLKIIVTSTLSNSLDA